MLAPYLDMLRMIGLRHGKTALAKGHLERRQDAAAVRHVLGEALVQIIASTVAARIANDADHMQLIGPIFMQEGSRHGGAPSEGEEGGGKSASIEQRS